VGLSGGGWGGRWGPAAPPSAATADHHRPHRRVAASRNAGPFSEPAEPPATTRRERIETCTQLSPIPDRETSHRRMPARLAPTARMAGLHPPQAPATGRMRPARHSAVTGRVARVMLKEQPADVGQGATGGAGTGDEQGGSTPVTTPRFPVVEPPPCNERGADGEREQGCR